uniref:CUB domain-containing protein n=1 Tax=Panagrolaimus davidi TaxID=227884 RepID=A0A914QJF2_9BILA
MSQSNGLIKNKYITTYTNVDYINGYPAYQKCENTITFPSNYEATIGVYELNYEACCDLLLLTYGNNQTIQLEADFDDDDGTYIPDLKHLNSKANGSILSFTSDGNIQEAGYKVILTTYGN